MVEKKLIGLNKLPTTFQLKKKKTTKNLGGQNYFDNIRINW